MSRVEFQDRGTLHIQAWTCVAVLASSMTPASFGGWSHADSRLSRCSMGLFFLNYTNGYVTKASAQQAGRESDGKEARGKSKVESPPYMY
jgi:hypothetical protein